jgi:Mrp family chromosome partitioning ATPase
MERLQAALEKARANRSGGQPVTVRERPTPRRQRAAGVEEAWSAVAEYDVRADQLRSQRIVAMTGGRDATAIDVLRTKMLQQMRQNEWRRVAITSPGSACGKTTVAINLAASLARQSELRTVLIDLDMRRPAIAKLLLVKDRPSFWDVVEGRTTFAEQALRLNENVIVSVNTAPAAEPSEIMASSAIKRVIAEIEATYQPDIMMFDMPPMLVTDDNLAFFDKVDCALLVAAAESTTIQQVDVCERDLATQTSLLGVILNKCRYMDAAGYDYAYY